MRGLAIIAMAVSCALIPTDGEFRAAPLVVRDSPRVRGASLTWMPPTSLSHFSRGQDPPLLRMRGAGDASATNPDPATSPAADPVGVGAGKAPPMRVAPSHGDVVVGLGARGRLLSCDHPCALAITILAVFTGATTIVVMISLRLTTPFPADRVFLFLFVLLSVAWPLLSAELQGTAAMFLRWWRAYGGCAGRSGRTGHATREEGCT